MSYGLCVCSECRREVHQRSDVAGNLFWFHCEDGSRIDLECKGTSAYPKDRSDIKGKFCGADDLDKVFK